MNTQIELDRTARQSFSSYMYAELEESEQRYRKSLRSMCGDE